MKLLLITNLYPPQELGGYGRSMADFAWGLRELGHSVNIICSDAPYLESNSSFNNENINRNLLLKGSFRHGVQHILDPHKRKQIDNHNNALLYRLITENSWDGILIGNIDLIGYEILDTLTKSELPILHHIGFMDPPFESIHLPSAKNYKVVASSEAVKKALIKTNFAKQSSPVVYPGARVELYGQEATKRPLPPLPNGTFNSPLCISYAGLLMATKGLHTLIEAIVKLKQRSIFTRTLIAGGDFQEGYQEVLKNYLEENKLDDSVYFTGSLERNQLARFFRLNHVFVFPSIYPEAFGIVQAEAMASGLALITSGVGGSKEVLKEGITGFSFHEGNSDELCKKLTLLIKDNRLIKEFGIQGEEFARANLSVMTSAKQLEELIINM